MQIVGTIMDTALVSLHSDGHFIFLLENYSLQSQLVYFEVYRDDPHFFCLHHVMTYISPTLYVVHWALIEDYFCLKNDQ